MAKMEQLIPNFGDFNKFEKYWMKFNKVSCIPVISNYKSQCKIFRIHSKIKLAGYLRILSCGKVWKDRIKLYPKKICIQFFLYFDEFEINDPLKPHSCGIGAVLINLPTEYLSVLENVFPALFFKSEYTKYGNNATFNILIDEI